MNCDASHKRSRSPALPSRHRQTSVRRAEMSTSQALLEHANTIRQEHDYLLGELESLESALARVSCYSEVYANFDGAAEACGVATRMMETVLRHFDHEEHTILKALGR